MGLPTERDRLWNRRSVDIPPHTSKIIGPTKEEKDRANAATGRLTDQQGVSTPVTLSLIGGAALVGGVGGWFIRDAVASENPFEESIGSFPNSFNKNDSGVDIEPSNLEQPFTSNPQSEPEPPKVNPEGGVTSGVITPEIRKMFTPEKIQQLNSFARFENQKTEIVTVPEELRAKYGLPEEMKFIIGEDMNTIEILPTILDLSQTSKSDADLEYVMTGLSQGSVEYDLFHDKGYFQHIEFRMKDGSRIPKGAIVNMFLVNEKGGYLLQDTVGAGHKAGKEALIDIQPPNGDIYRFKVIASNGEGKNTEFVSLDPLVPAPDYNAVLRDIKARGTRYSITYGYNVVGGQPILQLSENAYRISIHLLTSLEGKEGETTWPSGLPTFVLSNLAMFTPDGETLAPRQSSNTSE